MLDTHHGELVDDVWRRWHGEVLPATLVAGVLVALQCVNDVCGAGMVSAM